MQTTQTNPPSSVTRIPLALISITAFVVLALGIVGYLTLANPSEVADSQANDVALAPAPLPGRPAPDFTLSTLDGQPVQLSDLQGQPVILNFWATWCSPCRVEMPDLQAAHADHVDDGVVILGVNLTRRDNLDDVPGFLDEFGITYPVVLDERGEVTNLYKVRGQPASVFIDKDGVVNQVFYGPVNKEFIETRIAELIES